MPSSQPSPWRRNIFAVSAASFIGFMGFTLVMPFLPLYFQQLGVTEVGEIALWSGLSLGATPAVTALLAPAWGAVADRFGRKLMVERSLLSFVLVMAATAYVTRPWHVLALRCVQGLFAGYGALTLTMAVDSAPESKTTQAIGFVQTAQRLGPAIGPVVGGVLAQLVGLRGAFLVAASFYAAAFVLVLVLYREQPIVRPNPRQPEARRITFRSILAFRYFLLLMVGIFGFQFVDRSLGPILPLLVAELGVSLAGVPLISGLLFSTAACAAAAGHHLCSRLLRRMSTANVIALGATLAGVAIAVGAFAGHLAVLFGAIPVFGFGVGVSMTAAYTAGSQVIPAAARATGFGFLTSASLAGLAMSPMVSGFLGAVSIRAVFVVDAIVLGTLALTVGNFNRTSETGPATPEDSESAGSAVRPEQW